MPTEIPVASKPVGSELLQTVRTRAWGLAGFFALVTLALRFAPLPENFATFGALALFCGIFLQGPARWWVPCAVLFIADCIGQVAKIPGMGFYDPTAMALNYIGFALMASVGTALAAWWHRSGATVAVSLATVPLGALVGSTLFFLVSNFGAWLDPRMGYESTLAGLRQCYWMGLPYWRFTVTSDLVFGLGFAIAAWGIATAMQTQSRRVAV